MSPQALGGPKLQKTKYMASPTDIRKGRVIMYNGVPHAVMSMLHRTQGRQAGFVQTVLRNLSNNSSTAVKFRSTDSVEFCHTTNKPFEFSYVDGDHFHFIDPETYDDIVLMKETIGDDVKWLVEGVQYNILFVDGNPVSIELPNNMEIKVAEAAEGLSLCRRPRQEAEEAQGVDRRAGRGGVGLPDGMRGRFRTPPARPLQG